MIRKILTAIGALTVAMVAAAAALSSVPHHRVAVCPIEQTDDEPVDHTDTKEIA